VLDDEDAEEVGITAGTEHVPGKRCEAKAGDGDGMKTTKGVAPAFGEDRPKKNGAARKNDGNGTLCENGEAKEKPEENKGEPWSARKNRRIFVASETNDRGSKYHSNGEHGGEGHIGSRGVGKANHADGGRQQKQEPAGGFRAVEAPCKPGHRQSGEKSGKGAGKARGSFVHAKKFEAEGGSPVEQRGLFKPGMAVESRRNPVAGFRHIAGNPGIARLIRTDETESTEIVEVTEVECGEDKENPREANGQRGWRVVAKRVVGLRHGKLSLALKVYREGREVRHTGAKAQEGTPSR
jgi:hypothetical protein